MPESDEYRDGFAGLAAPEGQESVRDDEYSRGYEAGVEDREQCHQIAAHIILMLDGDPITQFKTLDELSDWLDTVNAYEKLDQDVEDEELNHELLEMVYKKLIEAGKKSSGMRLGLHRSVDFTDCFRRPIFSAITSLKIYLRK